MHQLASSLSFGVNPLARPPGGVPILGPQEGGISAIKSLYPSDHEDISDTESSIHVSDTGQKGFVVLTHVLHAYTDTRDVCMFVAMYVQVQCEQPNT